MKQPYRTPAPAPPKVRRSLVNRVAKNGYFTTIVGALVMASAYMVLRYVGLEFIASANIKATNRFVEAWVLAPVVGLCLAFFAVIAVAVLLIAIEFAGEIGRSITKRVVKDDET